MKKIISFLFFVLMLGIAQAAFAQGENTTLRVGQQKTTAGGKVRVKLISVMEDSRCPTDVDCVWAGNAKVKVRVFVRGGETKTFELNTSGPDKAGQADAYRVQLESLTPGRKSNKNIRQRDYRVTFSINKLSR